MSERKVYRVDITQYCGTSVFVHASSPEKAQALVEQEIETGDSSLLDGMDVFEEDITVIREALPESHDWQLDEEDVVEEEDEPEEGDDKPIQEGDYHLINYREEKPVD